MLLCEHNVFKFFSVVSVYVKIKIIKFLFFPRQQQTAHAIHLTAYI